MIAIYTHHTIHSERFLGERPGEAAFLAASLRGTVCARPGVPAAVAGWFLRMAIVRPLLLPSSPDDGSRKTMVACMSMPGINRQPMLSDLRGSTVTSPSSAL
jgi:hypothetical protein